MLVGLLTEKAIVGGRAVGLLMTRVWTRPALYTNRRISDEPESLDSENLKKKGGDK